LSYLAKHWARIAVTLLPLLFAVGHTTKLNIGLLQTLNNTIYDAKLRWFMPRTLDTRIVIVDIDEKSLSEIGQWPWSRNKLAALTNELFNNQEIALLGFDLVFAEPDGSSGLQYLNELAKKEFSSDPAFQAQLSLLAPKLDFDALFAQSMQQNKIVLSYYFTSDRQARTSGVLPEPILVLKNRNTTPLRTTLWDGFGSNIPKIAAAAQSAGFFNAIASQDGVVRSVPLIASYQGDYYESLSLAMYRAYKGYPKVVPNMGNTVYESKTHVKSIESIALVDVATNQVTKKIEVDDRAAILVPYRGFGGVAGGSFQYISAADLLNKRYDSAALAGKIVLVGSSAPGLQDLRITPVGETYPGVETHANMLSSMLDGKSIYTPDYALGLEVFLLLVVGLVLAFVLPSLSAMRAVVFSVAMLLVPMVMNVYLFGAHGVALPSATLIFVSLFSFMLNMSYGYIVESKSKRDLSKLFGSYVPPQLVDEMLLETSNHTMKATNKVLTVMFCDLRGFTQLSEKLAPLELQRMLNDIFGRLTRLIIERRGTVDKYMGDSVMAFWGAPVSTENHAELAVLTALDIMQAVKQLNKEYRAAGLPEIKLGIGINTGTMCVGDMGSFMRRSYTVVGDAVNIASRLQALTKNYTVDLLVGPATQASTPQFEWREVDKVQLEGKISIMEVFTVKNL
jgi:adenylate cyclase